MRCWILLVVVMTITGCAHHQPPAQCPIIDQWQKHRFTFKDAKAYCRWVNHIQAPDRRYIGPAVPDAIQQTLAQRQQSLTSQQSVHWRCQQGKLWYCVSRQRQACQTPLVAKPHGTGVWQQIKE